MSVAPGIIDDANNRPDLSKWLLCLSDWNIFKIIEYIEISRVEYPVGINAMQVKDLCMKGYVGFYWNSIIFADKHERDCLRLVKRTDCQQYLKQ